MNIPKIKVMADTVVKLRPLMLESLNRLPLQNETLQLLESCMVNCEDPKKPGLIPLREYFRLNLDYELAKQKKSKVNQLKALESIIYRTHFVWDNKLSNNMFLFKKNYGDLLTHWPYEFHKNIVQMENPKKTSMKYLWEFSSFSNFIDLLKKSCNTNEINPILREIDNYSLPVSSNMLSEIEREDLFERIFEQLFFLKSNLHFCRNGKNICSPIVEIPITPLGESIHKSRIKNLLNKKVKEIWNILTVQSPSTSLEKESYLKSLLSSIDRRDRSTYRLYQMAFSKTYVYDNYTENTVYRPASFLQSL